jgi:Tol biopolymer transport system component
MLCLGFVLLFSGCGAGTGQSTPPPDSGPPQTTSKVCGVGATVQTLPPITPTGPPITTAPWASSYNWRIAISAYGQPRLVLTDGDDFKPSWSQTGSLLTFFHTMQYGDTFDAWKTKLCVIGADGSNPRILSNGQYADFNPTWTRDGTNQIIFNRYAVRGSTSNDIYLISPQGSVGDEVLVSTPSNGYEWAFSGLKDGRIFIDRIVWTSTGAMAQSFLLTPHPGGTPTYEEITRPTTLLWQKLTVSPSETKVTYMLDNNGDMSTYNDDVLYYADFDVKTRVVSNPVAFTTYDLSQISEYPSWSADESYIIYDSNRSGIYRMYAYKLADGTTTEISDDATTNFQFGDFINLPK